MKKYYQVQVDGKEMTKDLYNFVNSYGCEDLCSSNLELVGKNMTDCLYSAYKFCVQSPNKVRYMYCMHHLTSSDGEVVTAEEFKKILVKRRVKLWVHT